METIARSLKKLSAGLDDHVKLVFVTTDPARDSPQALRSWLDHFDRRFVGLTGTEAAIEAAQVAAGVPPARKASRAGESDAVGHANFVLAYTTDNLAHVIYPGGLTQEDWAHDLPQLVRETWPKR
jgi:protein SCO1/2